jgi:hypothetical protein
MEEELPPDPKAEPGFVLHRQNFTPLSPEDRIQTSPFRKTRATVHF